MTQRRKALMGKDFFASLNGCAATLTDPLQRGPILFQVRTSDLLINPHSATHVFFGPFEIFPVEINMSDVPTCDRFQASRRIRVRHVAPPGQTFYSSVFSSYASLLVKSFFISMSAVPPTR